MSCIVLCIERAQTNTNRELGVFSQECSWKTQLVYQKSTNPRTERFGVQKTCTEMRRTVDVWVTVSLQTNFLEL